MKLLLLIKTDGFIKNKDTMEYFLQHISDVSISK